MGNRRLNTGGKHPGPSTRGATPRARGVRPLWVALGLVAGGVVYAAADRETGLVPWHRLGVEVERADARVRAARVRNARLAEEIRALREDPAALETAIREGIGWVRPGELRVDVETPDALPARVPTP